MVEQAAERMLTTGEVAGYCGVHFRTVLRWIERGRLKAHRLPGGRGDHRIERSEFLAFLRENRLPVPAELEEHGARVLVVDDDPAMAQGIARVLRNRGYEVEVAHNGLMAGLMLHQFSPQLMTLDLRMPGLNGFDVLRSIRHTPLPTPVKVLVVSAVDASELDTALEQGADDALAKPFDNEILVERVKALIGAP